MIRLNGFFNVPEDNLEEFLTLAKELVDKARNDAGRHFYALVQDAFDPTKMNFIETWEDEEALAAHGNAEHFTRIVPRLKELTENGMHLDRMII